MEGAASLSCSFTPRWVTSQAPEQQRDLGGQGWVWWLAGPCLHRETQRCHAVQGCPSPQDRTDGSWAVSHLPAAAAPRGLRGSLPQERLAFLAYLRSGLDFQVWILLLFIDILRGVQRMAGNAAAPQVLSPGRYCSALAEAGCRQGCPGDLPLPGGGSAVSLQREVMFPGLGRKGLQLPACVGIQDIVCWALGAAGCTLPRCRPLLCRVAGPWSCDRTLLGHDAQT